MHEKEIPGFTRIGSTAGQAPFALRVRTHSPQAEAEAFTYELGDPANEPPGWSPLTGVSAKIGAYLDQMREHGKRIMGGVVQTAKDAASSVGATYTESLERGAIIPGEEFAFAGQAIAAGLPAAVQAFTAGRPALRSCGTITTSDGRVFQVPCASDDVMQAERARSDLQKNASRAGNYDAALERAKLQLAAKKEAARQDEYSHAFALKERQVAQALDISELQERALELAIERETSSPAQRALWGRPSTIAPEPPSHRTVKMIGPGVPGGIIQRLY